jgi:chaperonin GroES
MNFKPLNNNILIKPLAVEQITASGIFIPDTAKGKSLKGEVKAIGNVDVRINVGDIVLFAENSGAEIKIDGDDYLIMDEKYLYGIL